MKILFVDNAIDGHHEAYLTALMSIEDVESVVALPARIVGYNCTQYIYKPIDFMNKKFSEFMKWIKEIREIADKEKPDIIHFLYGDVFYKFLGIGLGVFEKYKTILTIHWARQKRLDKISLKLMLSKVYCGVFHTSLLTEEVRTMGIKNAIHIEYPYLGETDSVDVRVAKNYFNITDDSKLLVCLGNTRYDKGLDILLRALSFVSGKFNLLIAGKEQAFDRMYIEKETKQYANKVYLQLNYLSSEEYKMALNAADIIVVPYRKKFNGASGPLSEGVWHEKPIIGPNHGALGTIINDCSLGYTFESENAQSLAGVINGALANDFTYNIKAQEYRKSLNVDVFRQRYKEIYESIT